MSMLGVEMLIVYDVYIMVAFQQRMSKHRWYAGCHQPNPQSNRL
jgi:hypothetical protein